MKFSFHSEAMEMMSGTVQYCLAHSYISVLHLQLDACSGCMSGTLLSSLRDMMRALALDSTLLISFEECLTPAGMYLLRIFLISFILLAYKPHHPPKILVVERIINEVLVVDVIVVRIISWISYSKVLVPV